jgi:hypothetical protein
MKHPETSFPKYRWSRAQTCTQRSLHAFLWALLLTFASCSEFLSPDITNKVIVLNSPADSLYTASNINFWWEKDTDIAQYQLRVTTATAGNLLLRVDTTLVTNTISYNFAQDAAYQWQLRGVNEGSVTAWTQRTFIIDRTAPDKATASQLDGDTIATGTTAFMQWYSTDLPIDGITYPVSDSLILYRKNDSITIGSRLYFSASAPRSLPITATSPAPLNGPGTYYWRVVTMDRAGNRKTSDQFQFTVL